MQRDLVRLFALLSGAMVITGIVNRHDLVVACIDGGIALVCLAFAVITTHANPMPIRP